jgi:hypothetical protein
LSNFDKYQAQNAAFLRHRYRLAAPVAKVPPTLDFISISAFPFLPEGVVLYRFKSKKSYKK